MGENATKPIREVYPDLEDDFSYGPCDYGPMLHAIGNIALEKDDDDYQGDSYVLYRDGDRWGYLAFGWGSCSGCDALQGSSSWADLNELYERLIADVHWEDSALLMLRWIANRDWAGGWSWGRSTQHTFLIEATALLVPEAFKDDEED